MFFINMPKWISQLSQSTVQKSRELTAPPVGRCLEAAPWAMQVVFCGFNAQVTQPESQLLDVTRGIIPPIPSSIGMIAGVTVIYDKVGIPESSPSKCLRLACARAKLH
jgi:hypothetical protein